MKRNKTLFALLIVAATLLSALAPLAVSADTTVYTATDELSASEVEALNLALQDEYKALATYEQVMADFGAVRPFGNIARAEEQHIAALTGLFEYYGLEVPANEWLGQMPSFSSLLAAAEAGVQAEIDNAALYDQLFSMVEHDNIITVFESLSSASEAQHLPAFERYIARW